MSRFSVTFLVCLALVVLILVSVENSLKWWLACLVAAGFLMLLGVGVVSVKFGFFVKALCRCRWR